MFLGCSASLSCFLWTEDLSDSDVRPALSPGEWNGAVCSTYHCCHADIVVVLSRTSGMGLCVVTHWAAVRCLCSIACELADRVLSLPIYIGFVLLLGQEDGFPSGR